MIVLYATIIVLVCLLVCLQTKSFWTARDTRRRGKLPKGRATMFDVRHLLMEGEKDLAIRVYCDIFNVSFRQAKKDIEELERSLKV